MDKKKIISYNITTNNFEGAKEPTQNIIFNCLFIWRDQTIHQYPYGNKLVLHLFNNSFDRLMFFLVGIIIISVFRQSNIYFNNFLCC